MVPICNLHVLTLDVATASHHRTLTDPWVTPAAYEVPSPACLLLHLNNKQNDWLPAASW